MKVIYDPERKAIKVHGYHARLAYMEAELFDALLKANGQLVASSTLAIGLRCDIGDLKVYIYRLRKKLGPARNALETVNKRGYLIDPVNIKIKQVDASVSSKKK